MITAVGILLYGATLLGFDLGRSRVLTYHEVLIAQPAKEMLATCAWIVPMFAGVPQPDKPPLAHWLVAASMAVFDSDAEWVVRLPGVIAALVTALAVYQLGRRWFGRRVGVIAALIHLTSVYTLMQARLAEADMPLCSLVTVAICTFGVSAVGQNGQRSTTWTAWIFWTTAGSAFLTKGPVALALIFPACLLFLLFERQSARVLLHRGGLVVFTACVLVWPLAAALSHPPVVDAWLADNLGRFRGELGSRSVFFYFWTVPWLLLPWTGATVVGAIEAARDRDAAVAWRFLGIWFGAGLVILSASAFKHHHYAIPLLPPLAIVSAKGLVSFVRWCRERDYVRIGIDVQLATLFALAWCVPLLVWRLAMPHFDSYRDQADLARRINQRIRAGAPLYLVELPSNQITYYLRPPLVRIDSLAEFTKRPPASAKQPMYVVAPQRVADTLSKAWRVDVVDRCVSLRKGMTEQDRLVYFRLGDPAAVQPEGATSQR